MNSMRKRNHVRLFLLMVLSCGSLVMLGCGDTTAPSSTGSADHTEAVSALSPRQELPEENTDSTAPERQIEDVNEVPSPDGNSASQQSVDQQQPVSRDEGPDSLSNGIVNSLVHVPRVVFSDHYQKTCLKSVGDSLADLSFQPIASDTGQSMETIESHLGEKLTVFRLTMENNSVKHSYC